ncbi:MAG: hypothetical protein O3A29_19815, partial [Planctomycetota bacterium]|nr:hypothetical protein [Planctomycetota bacterium]
MGIKNAGLAFLSILLVLSSQSQAANITFFHPSVFSPNTAEMDVILGVAGYTIEDFEDTTLVPGLSISYTGNGFDETHSTLFQIQTVTGQYPPPPQEPDPTLIFNRPWDGVSHVNNDPDNPIPFNTLELPDLISFNFSGGVNSVGVGLTGFQS